MQLHRLTIVGEGSRAPSEQLDPNHMSEVAAGVELLLSANAYFYTEGRVPRDGHPSTGYFSFGSASSSDELRAWEAWVRIRGSEVYDPTTYTFSDQLLGSIAAWDRGDLLPRPPELARAHAVPLPGVPYNATWENEPPIRTQILRLSRCTARAMDMIARSAANTGLALSFILDGAVVLRLGCSSLEQELAEYSRRVRGRGGRAQCKVG